MAQTEAFNSLKEDILQQTDPVTGEDSSETDEIDDSRALDLNAAMENLLGLEQRPKLRYGELHGIQLCSHPPF